MWERSFYVTYYEDTWTKIINLQCRIYITKTNFLGLKNMFQHKFNLKKRNFSLFLLSKQTLLKNNNILKRTSIFSHKFIIISQEIFCLRLRNTVLWNKINCLNNVASSLRNDEIPRIENPPFFPSDSIFSN